MIDNIRIYLYQQYVNFKFSLLKKDNSNKKTALFPGCAMYNENRELVQKVYDYLYSKNSDIKLVIDCCGKPLDTTNYENKKEKNSNKLIGRLSGLEEIIVICPNCYKKLSNYKDIKIIHILEIIAKDEELLKSKYKKRGKIHTHIPCHFRKNNEMKGYIDTILEVIGFEVVHHKDICCGAKDMKKMVDYKTYEKVNKLMINDYDKNDSVVNFCFECNNGFLINDFDSKHFLEYIFN